MKPVEPRDYPYADIEIKWIGPYVWHRGSSVPKWDSDIAHQRGWYRAEQSGRNRAMIKYIGSATVNFLQRLRGEHRVKKDLHDISRETRMFFGVQQGTARLTRTDYVEIEYILQNVHWSDLVSYHGLSKLPKTSRGMAWRIKNSGYIGDLFRYIHYPTFSVSKKERL